MSFFSDLFEGKWKNLGTDITHAPSSFVRDINTEWPGIAAAAALAIPFVGPEISAGIGAADLFGTGVAAADVAGGATAADIAAGAGDVAAADIAAGGGATAADIAATGGADALATMPADALALAPDAASGGAFQGLDLSGGTGLSQAASDVAPTSDAAAIQSLSSGFNPPSGAIDQAMAGGGGEQGGLSGILNNQWTKMAIGATPLALTLARGEPSLPPQISAAQANAQQLASQGSNLNQSQNSVLTQMRQDLINSARQAMFNQGVQNPEADSRWTQWLGQIDSQVSAAAQQMIQQNIQNSLQGDQQLIQIAQLQMQSDQAFTNNLVRATTAMGSAVGLGGGLKLVSA